MVDDGRRTDDGRTDGRTTEHGYTISSPCEPDGSGELKTPDLSYAKTKNCSNSKTFLSGRRSFQG